MIRSHRSAENYRAITDPDKEKRIRLYRAAIALSAIVLLMIGLTLFSPDESSTESESNSDLTQTQDNSVEVPALQPKITIEKSTAEPNTTPPAIPPSPAVEDAQPPVALATPESSPKAPTQPATPAVTSPLPATAKTPPKIAKISQRKTATKPTQKHRILVQDFASTAKSKKILVQLQRANLPIIQQQRIITAPFPDKPSAQKLQNYFHKKYGINGFIVASAQGFRVQLGVFSKANNAERLRNKLAKGSAQPVQIETRLLLGTYSSADKAQQALSALQKKYGIKGRLLP